MPEETLACPKCGTRIPLTKALTAPIEARLRAQIGRDVKEKEDELAKREKSIEGRESKLDAKIREGVDAQIPKIIEKQRKEISAKYDGKLKELADDLGLATERAEKAENEERELRKNKKQLEDREKALDLEVGRKVEEAAKILTARIRDEHADATKLKEQAWQLKEDGLRNEIEVLQQKLDQGSQQAQGEALEVELEEELRSAFPTDVIEPVPTGVRGADLVHRVFTPSGQPCGVIIWETKRTKEWSDAWIPKLREDTARFQGDASILVSRALPEGVRNFSFSKGVVVSDFACAIPVATLVRLRLLELARQKRVDETAPEVREELYAYLTSPEFIGRVENIVVPLVSMKQDLESEIRSIELRWRRRRKEIEKAEKSIIGIYGDLQGIVGKAKLPEVAQLGLPPAVEDPGSAGEED